MGEFVHRHGLVSLYALAYFISWLFWMPYVLSQNGLGVLDVSFPKILGDTQLAGILLGAYLGPLGAAFLVTAISEGRPGLRRWVGRLFRWRVGWRWYALALVGVPALLVAGTLAVSPGAAAGLRFPPLELLLVYVPFLLLQMVTTGLAEEPGWRDFALVHHQRLHGPLLGTLILGALWVGWHLPLFLTEWGRENGGVNPSSILSFVLFCLLFSVVITWVFNKTRGSLPQVMLVHVSNNNFASVLLFAMFTTLNPSDATLSWAGVIGFAVPALAIVAATRGRLGYRPELFDDEPERELGGVPGGTGGVTADHKVIWTEKSRPRKLVPIFWHPHRPLQLKTGRGGVGAAHRVDCGERRDAVNHTEEIRGQDGGFGQGGALRARRLVRVLLSALFLLSSLPFGLLWFVVLATLLLMGLPLTIVWVGLPILALAMVVCVYGVRIERWRLAVLLNVHLASPFRPLPRGLVLTRVRVRATDPALWRGLLYLILLLPIGLVELVVVLVPILAAFLVSYPLWFWTLPEGTGVTWTGVFVADTVPEALLVMLIGLVFASAAAAFVPQVSQAHAWLGRILLAPSSRNGLEERVEVLTEGRSKAVEAAIAERRRIERDLHDGAQQRLVSLAMALGMARQKLEKGSPGGVAKGPETARAAELVGEAHEEAKLALAEIRDLIRGIHPAVLTDRGLDAAISALAGRSPVPTSVEVELDERPPEAVEITAYFVIAEALANVAKHSGASQARISVRRQRDTGDGELSGDSLEDLLVVEVEDDGGGGADPAGAGLAGLADRVMVLDGCLTVESPSGGPTRVRAEMPWGSRDRDRNGG
ncbi:MAG: sensor domain-containing protein [Rubrobacteraceae bacterium]